MTYDIVMPQLGLTMEEGAVVAWQKKLGDWVKKGEVLFIVETDKSEMEVESTDTGYLNFVAVELRKKVRVGSVIAALGDRPGEIGTAQASGAAASAAPPTTGTPPASSLPNRPEGGAAHPAPSSLDEGSEFAASPRAKKLAKELGVDIRAVKPASGRRIVEDDVRRHHESA